jgi:hypothetical protein
MVPGLLNHANVLARGGHWADAAKVYDHLVKLQPGFLSYEQGLERALAAVRRQGGGCIPQVSLAPGAPAHALETRTLEVLLRHGLVGPEAVSAYQRPPVMGPDLGLLTVTAALRAGTAPAAAAGWARALDAWLARWGGCRLEPSGEARFSAIRLRALGAGADGGPKVTVAMSCFNNAETVEAAALSVLGQTHRNLELVIVDDASTDASRAALAALAAQDPRIRVLFNTKNQGTYANRNRVWAQSDAEFFCCLDADDIALPGRLAHQCHLLQAQPHALGVVSSWVRMTADGLPVYQNQGAGGFVHHAVSTMMLRREPVLKSLGYWDAVRFEADSEFMCRLQAVHGKQALLWDNTVTALALSRAGSLTQDPATGLDDIFGPSPMRQQYREAWRAWHASGAQLYLGLQPQPRPFAAPPEMLP